MKITTRLIEKGFREYYRPLCLYAWTIVGSEDDAKEVVQQFFVELLEIGQNEKMREVKNWKGYLFICVRNRCLQCIRRSCSTVSLDEVKDIPENDEENQELAEREARLWDWIDALPEQRRKILLAAKQEGLSYRDIACKFDISEKTVEMHLGKAIKALRKAAVKVYLFFFG